MPSVISAVWSVAYLYTKRVYLPEWIVYSRYIAEVYISESDISRSHVGPHFFFTHGGQERIFFCEIGSHSRKAIFREICSPRKPLILFVWDNFREIDSSLPMLPTDHDTHLWLQNVLKWTLTVYYNLVIQVATSIFGQNKWRPGTVISANAWHGFKSWSFMNRRSWFEHSTVCVLFNFTFGRNSIIFSVYMFNLWRNTLNPHYRPYGTGTRSKILTHDQGWGLLSWYPPFRYFPNFSTLWKHVSYRISRLYLTGIAAAQMRWHLSNMHVIEKIWQVLSQDRKFCSRRNKRTEL